MTTDTRKTNATGQLRPLDKRMSLSRQALRTERRAYRITLAQQAGITRGMALASLNVTHKRGFFGRLKWLLIGR